MSTPDSTPPPGKKSSPLLLGCLIAAVVAAGLTFLLIAKTCSMVSSRFTEITSEMEKNPARSAAMLLLRMTPNVEVLSTDDAKNSVTFKDTKTGKVATMSFDDIAKGKLTVKDSDGHEVTVDASQAKGSQFVKVTGPEGTTVIGADSSANLPAWVPNYPGSAPRVGGMKAETNGVLSGIVVTETTDPLTNVKEFFEGKLKTDGYKIEIVPIGDNASVITAKKDSPKTSINITIGTDNGKTTVNVSYEGPK